MPSHPRFYEAAVDILFALRCMTVVAPKGKLAKSSVAIIGALAINRHIASSVKSVDLLVDQPAEDFQQQLLLQWKTPFVWRNGRLYYRSANLELSSLVPVNCYRTTDMGLSMPRCSMRVVGMPRYRKLKDAEMPYPPQEDLILHEILACAQVSGVVQLVHAGNAEVVLRDMTPFNGTPHLRLTNAERIALEPHIAEVVQHSGWDEPWWRKRLDMLADED